MQEKDLKCKLVSVSGNLPFTPSFDDVIYADGKHTIRVERWRIDYYRDVLDEMMNVPVGYEEGYFSMITKMLQDPVFWEYFTDSERRDIEHELIDKFNFIDFLSESKDFFPAIYILNNRLEDIYEYRQYGIGKEGILPTLKTALASMDQRDAAAGEEYVRYSDMPATRDELIQQYLTLTTQLEACRKQLHALGLTDNDISGVATIAEEPLHIYIEHRGKIYVRQADGTDMGEVRMSPLDKAVFLLYLNHPEGISFKDLTEYRDELLATYRKLMNCRTNSAMIQSVDDLVNPLENSINEKCARIRRAFCSVIGANLSSMYYITGRRGDKKFITLDRQYVHNELKNREYD